MWVEGEPAVEGDAENFDLVGNGAKDPASLIAAVLGSARVRWVVPRIIYFRIFQG